MTRGQEKQRSKAARGRAFTLLELLAVIAIVALLGGLLLPALNRSKHTARRATCMNNLRQVNIATRLYADEHGDRITLPASARATGYLGCHVKQVVKGYVGYSGGPSRNETLFQCPEDRFYYNQHYFDRGLCEESENEFSSYGINIGNMLGRNVETGAPFVGIGGTRLSSISIPSQVVQVCEASGFIPFSWHKPQTYVNNYRFNNSMNMLSFVDGHVSFGKIYYAGGLEAWHYNPPAPYEYQWSDSPERANAR